MREVLVHAAGVVKPHGGPGHDVEASRAEDAKVEGRVHLLHEAGLLGTGVQAGDAGQRPEDLLHEELAGEGEDDGVEDDKGNIPDALAVLDGAVEVGLGHAVGEEDEMGEGVGGVGVDGIAGEDAHDHGQGEGPGMARGIELDAANQRPSLPSLRQPLFPGSVVVLLNGLAGTCRYSMAAAAAAVAELTLLTSMPLIWARLVARLPLASLAQLDRWTAVPFGAQLDVVVAMSRVSTLSSGNGSLMEDDRRVLWAAAIVEEVARRIAGEKAVNWGLSFFRIRRSLWNG